jgi:BMFP domain-containing protein YqiC
MHEEIQTLRKDMETGFHGFAMILKSIQEDIQDFKKVKIEVAELRHRVERLEAKLGIAS